MSRHGWTVLGIGLVIALSVGGFLAGQVTAEEPEDAMYKVLDLKPPYANESAAKFEALLNKMAKEGWVYEETIMGVDEERNMGTWTIFRKAR